jgi:FkbM family methyltransferase
MNYFFDIGANIGQTFDDYLLKTNEYDGWEVFCFEPSPRHMAGLLRKAKEVGDRFNVTIFPCAVSEFSFPHELFEKVDPRGDSLQLKLWQGEFVPNRVAPYRVIAQCVTLPQLISRCSTEGDTLVVKLDCEGAEYGILRSLLADPYALSRISKLMVEFHKIETDSNESRAEEERLFEEFKKLGKPWEIWPY